MREIQDRDLLMKLYKKNGLTDCFSSMPRGMRLLKFERGEFVSQPLEPLTSFLFPVQGSLMVYGIRQNDQIFHVHLTESNTLQGDMEFLGRSPYPFFVEATGEVLCISIPFEPNRQELESDVRFLRFLSDQLALKLEMSVKADLIAPTLEESFLAYLEELPDHTMHGVNNTLVKLHCSRRQLQRVLKKLCDRGDIQKIGRGCYKKKHP